MDGVSEAAGVQQASGDVVVEVAESQGYALEGLGEPLMASVGPFALCSQSKNARTSPMRPHA